MTQLDKVYNSLVNLERNYKKSKKSRSEYIADKFGGDFDRGSFLIMSALSEQEFTDPVDIEKYSKVREVISILRAHKDHFDSLTTFDAEEKVDAGMLLSALDSTFPFRLLGQETLYKKYGVVHHRIYPNITAVAPLLSSRYVKICTPAMQAMFAAHSTDDVQLGDLLERQSVGGLYTKAKNSHPVF